MEQAGGCGLHDTTRSNDLLAILSTFVTHGDFSTGSTINNLTGNSSGVVVAANIEDSIVEPLSHSELETDCFGEHNPLQGDTRCVHEKCSCLEEENIETTEEVADTEEIEQFHKYRREVDATSAGTSAEGIVNSTGSGENYLSHNNICKTINDITNSHKTLNSDIAMPQNPVLESALSMSNITPSSVPSGNEFFPMPNLTGLDQSQSTYPAQSWPVGNMTDGINESVTCQASGYTSSRQSYSENVNSTFVPPFSGSTMDDGYLHDSISNNEYQNQQYLQTDDHTHVPNQLNHQFYQDSQTSLQGFQTPLNQHGLPGSGEQDPAPLPSTYNKVLMYTENSHCISNNAPMLHSHLTQNLPPCDGPGNSTPGNMFNKINNRLHVKERSDSGGEDNLLEDRSGEKKLTTTPIPSDADKMSSSSSISSGSHEESPSPRHLDSEQNNVTSLSANSLLSRSSSRNCENFDNLAQVDLSNQNDGEFPNKFNTSNALINEDSQNTIPLPENVVEIDHSSLEYDTANITPSSDGIPVSPSSLPGTDQVSCFTDNASSHNETGNNKLTDSVASTSDSQTPASNSTRLTETNSSWSVMKEERRKKRLEKKKHMKSQTKDDLTPAVNSLNAQHDNMHTELSRSSRKHSNHRHKHRHRPKRHNQEENENLLKKDSFQNRVPTVGINIPEQKSPKTNTYSGLIPKATADPTSNVHLSSTKYPGSITAKVKQQLQKNNSLKQSNQNLKSGSVKEVFKNNNQQSSKSVAPRPKDSKESQAVREMTIAPAKLGSFPKDNQTSKVGIRRWQTVTAIQGPKLPPMLSERDRIPKRGRPSKKMTELNLKYKAEANANTSVQDKSVNSTESSKIVAMYTINDGGFIQELENKPKQNQRSKERAEAFQKFLSDISKKTTIQKKTAGAKEVVGAFKANGVRTRKQALGQSVIEIDEKRKKCKTKNKVFGGEAGSGKSTNKSEALVEHGVYTFSELAKQYKISNSILHRALEQSQRSSLSKKTTKAQKNKESHRADTSLPKSNTTKDTSSAKVNSTVQEKNGKSSVEADELSQAQYAKQQSVDESSSTSIKPISLSSEKSIELGTTEVVKKKKKKKKHKKEKSGNNKKKKNKEKKKKLKRKDKHTKFVLSDSVFGPEANSDSLPRANESNREKVSTETDENFVEPKSSNKEHKSDAHTKPSLKQKNTVKPTSGDVSQSVDLNQPSPTCSVSSLSGCEDAYDGGDSSSDIEIKTNSNSQTKTSPSVTISSTVSASTSSTSAVFGSGIKSVMPSFQGIKEHGGLVHFSENVESSVETSLQKGRKHKHKKKKLIGRTKNAADPEFLGKMEELVKQLENIKVSSNPGFLTSNFSGNSSNIFATSFQNVTSRSCDAFSYRDPTRNSSSKHKRKKLHKLSSASRNSNSSTVDSNFNSSHSNMSAFCKGDFFKVHGFVKPFVSSVSFTPLSPKTSSSVTKERISFIKDISTESSLFSKKSDFAAFSVSKPSDLNTTNAAKTSENQDSLNEMEVANMNSVQKLGKRKRGWPRGKPRGPKSKKLSFDNDEDPKNNDVVSEKEKPVDKRRESFNSKTTNLVDKSEPAKTLSISNDSSKRKSVDAGNMSSTKTQKKLPISDSHGHKSLQQERKVNESSSSEGPLEMPVNQELVNCIKAAITERLTSPYVCSDTVAKTVDSAVASYLQSLNGDNSSPASKDNKLHSNSQVYTLQTAKPTMPMKKGRGRPPKNPNASNLLKLSTDKHPKKVWASLHKGSSLTAKRQPGRPKKRGPGRPRKYALDSAHSSHQNEKSSESATSETETASKSLPPFACRRASASYTPSNRAVEKSVYNEGLQEKLQKKSTRGRKPGSLKKTHAFRKTALSDNTNRNTEINGVTSIRKPKLSSEISGNFKKSTTEPSKEAELTDADELILETADGVMELSGNNIDSEEFQIFCSDFSSRSGVKKSIESVVAKLKSKRNRPVSCNNNFNENNNVSNEIINTADRANDVCDSIFSSTDSLKNSEFDVLGMSSKRKYRASGDFDTTKDTAQPPVKKRNSGVRNAADLKKVETKWLPLDEKKYQRAGLFSSAFKAGSRDDYNAEGNDSDVDVLFPPTPHKDSFLHENHKHFQLPYDIWKLYKQKRITPTQDVVNRFVVTDENIYFDTHSSVEHEKHVCNCVTQSPAEPACGPQCLNRLMYAECQPGTCPFKEKCCNQVIQKKKWWKDLERFQTNNKGWGIKTNSNIPKGTFITEYVGEVVSENEFKRRLLEVYSNYHNHYCLQLQSGVVIDAYRASNEARFINHSCRPNCEMQRWLVGGKYRLCLFAKHSINAGDELTFDYSSYAFNFDRLQPCSCGSSNCRGSIGGKSHRAIAESSLNRISKALDNNAAKRKTSSCKDKVESGQLMYTTINENHIQPTSSEEMRFIKQHRPFLFRNLARIKKQHERARLFNDGNSDRAYQARDKPGNDNETQKSIKLYDIIKEIFTLVITCKDDSGVSVAIPFFNLRSKQPSSDHYDHSKDPVDLSFVQDKIETKQYENLDEFSIDLLHAFRNAEKYFGRKSSHAKDVARLRRIFTSARNSAAARLGENDMKNKDKEMTEKQLELDDRRRNGDYIRCICGIYRDEGIMIQCEKCYVWQHCDCMKVSPDDYGDESAYFCEECDNREVPKEVEVVPQPPSAPPGHTFYLTLLKDNLLVKQGDCVRLIHDHCLRQRSSNNPPVRTSYRLQSHSTPDRMDFFRIKKLWTDDNGDKFAYGHHFIRPQDTKHSESQLFFTNELLATPFYEIVPLDAVVSLCCVMDLETFRKGKPKDYKEGDIYICQHRVDPSLRVINSVIKNRHPICTKPHVFDSYPVKIITMRNYQVPEHYRKTQSRRTHWLRSIDSRSKSGEEDSSDSDDTEGKEARDDDDITEVVSLDTDEPFLPGNERNVKKRRLNGILRKLFEDANTRGRKASQ